MLGSDARIIEPRRDRVALEDLTVVVLEQVRAVAVQHAGLAAVHGRGVAVRHVEAVAAGFDAVDLHALVVEEGMEEADGVRAAADAGDERIGEAPFALDHLLARPRGR